MIILAFYKAPGTWRDWLIRFFDRQWTWKTFWKTGRYSHCEFVERIHINELGHPMAICVAATKRDGNQVSRRMIVFIEEHWDFLAIEGDWPTALLYAHSQIAVAYDTWGAILSVTPVSWHNPNKLFCSEQMAQILSLATALDIKQPHRETPNSLFRFLTENSVTPHHIEAKAAGDVTDGIDSHMEHLCRSTDLTSSTEIGRT